MMTRHTRRGGGVGVMSVTKVLFRVATLDLGISIFRPLQARARRGHAPGGLRVQLAIPGTAAARAPLASVRCARGRTDHGRGSRGRRGVLGDRGDVRGVARGVAQGYIRPVVVA